MKSTKNTLSILATAAAVAFGGVAIAQSAGDSGSSSASSGTTEQSASNQQDRGLLGGIFGGSDNQSTQANSGNIDAQSSGSVDTQTMGNTGSGTAADTSLDSETQADASGPDMRSPQVDRN